MRVTLAAFLILALAGCSIQSNRPDYEYPANSDATGSDWPDLAVTTELVGAGQDVQTNASAQQAQADQLAARARALRERAARLRRLANN